MMIDDALTGLLSGFRYNLATAILVIAALLWTFAFDSFSWTRVGAIAVAAVVLWLGLFAADSILNARRRSRETKAH